MVSLTLLRRLNHPHRQPSSLSGRSPFTGAVVGFVLGESFTNPEITELTVSESENLVYIRQVGAVGFDGTESLQDLRRNWNWLLDVDAQRAAGGRRVATNMEMFFDELDRLV
jgi:hypothetical protein